MTTQELLEIASAVLGLSGALLLATKSRWAGWAFVLWLASNAGWMAFGAMTGHWALVGQHAGFSITSAIGVWTWLLQPMWAGLTDDLAREWRNVD